jgi:hypothetical protein
MHALAFLLYLVITSTRLKLMRIFKPFIYIYVKEVGKVSEITY